MLEGEEDGYMLSSLWALVWEVLVASHMRVRVRVFDSMLEISWSYHSNKLTILLC